MYQNSGDGISQLATHFSTLTSRLRRRPESGLETALAKSKEMSARKRSDADQNQNLSELELEVAGARTGEDRRQGTQGNVGVQVSGRRLMGAGEFLIS